MANNNDAAPTQQPLDLDARRQKMVMQQLAERGIHDTRVLDAMGRLPRERFLPADVRHLVYEDCALPIAENQTISQPYMVGIMSEALRLKGGERVLEIGTGSGYQCAVLAQLVEEVYTIERIDELLRNARRRLRKLAIGNVRSRHDDGRLGWPEQAPFDAILLTAAGTQLEQALLAQLAPGGCLVAPVGPPGRQALLRIRAGEDGWQSESLGLVSFVPLLGGTG
jgi:protein-L-isoaspartate(D-aspartate) O-methyltransferase